MMRRISRQSLAHPLFLVEPGPNGQCEQTASSGCRGFGRMGQWVRPRPLLCCLSSPMFQCMACKNQEFASTRDDAPKMMHKYYVAHVWKSHCRVHRAIMCLLCMCPYLVHIWCLHWSLREPNMYQMRVHRASISRSLASCALTPTSTPPFSNSILNLHQFT